LGLLKKTYGADFKPEKFRWLLERIEPDENKLNIILEQLNKKINTVETSSLGRLFDAVAAMIGLGSFNHFEAQLPMALEAIAAESIEEHYDFELINNTGKPLQLVLSSMIRQLIDDVRKGLENKIIAAKFHNCLAIALVEMAKRARESTKLDTVALSGGVFCNRYLANNTIKLLNKNGFCVLFHRDVPANDGGISLGQAAIAANLVSRVTNH